MNFLIYAALVFLPYAGLALYMESFSVAGWLLFGALGWYLGYVIVHQVCIVPQANALILLQTQLGGVNLMQKLGNQFPSLAVFLPMTDQSQEELQASYQKQLQKMKMWVVGVTGAYLLGILAYAGLVVYTF
jgi:hypothetical protein